MGRRLGRSAQDPRSWRIPLLAQGLLRPQPDLLGDCFHCGASSVHESLVHHRAIETAMADSRSDRFGDWVLFGPGKNVLTAPFLAQTTPPKAFMGKRGSDIPVRRCEFRFRRWRGKPIVDDFGGKEVLEFQGRPMFAELIVLRLLRQEGWDGVWVDNYSRKFRTEW